MSARKKKDAGSDLFKTTAEDKPRFIVLNAKSVRRCLATGVVSVPSVEEFFAPSHEVPCTSRQLLMDTDLRQAIKVFSAKDACVAELDLPVSEATTLEASIPVTLIKKLCFANRNIANDWAGRSKSFLGLGPLPEIEVLDYLEFTEVERLQIEEDARDGVSSHERSRQQVAGGMVLLLGAPHKNSHWMSKVANSSLPDRSLFESLLCEIFDLRELEVKKVLHVLEKKDLNSDTGIFEPRLMLDSLCDALGSSENSELQISKLKAWSKYVGEVLDNTRDANPDEFSDGGDILLRALQLMIRTTPLSDSKINEQLHVYQGAIGNQVGSLAKILTGWYQGFSHLAEKAKLAPLFSIGARIATGSPCYPLKFEFSEDTSGTFDVQSSLSEQGVQVASVLEAPPPAVKEFFFAAQHVFNTQSCHQVFGGQAWTVDYSRQNREVHFSNGDELVVGTLDSEKLIRFSSSLSLKRPRARGWVKNFESELLKIASELSCVLSSTGYPELSFHTHQLVSTKDHEEIVFHVKAIVDAKIKVRSLHDELLGHS